MDSIDKTFNILKKTDFDLMKQLLSHYTYMTYGGWVIFTDPCACEIAKNHGWTIRELNIEYGKRHR